MVLVLNRLNLPQGLHAPFVATGAVVIFALAEVGHGSGFLAVYVAGLVVGNSAIRAHNTVVTFLDAATWLAQIGMFVVLGLLSWPERLPQTILPALAVAATLMLVARPAAVFLCLAPYPFNWREKTFMSWVGLRGAVGIFIASIPLLVGLPNAQLYFDIGFVVVLVSLLVQGWTIAPAARGSHVSFPRSDPLPRRVELDLPGQLEQEIVGYPLARQQPVSAARRCCRPGRGRRWWCATSASSARPKPNRCARATTSICWRRPSGRRRSTASLSTCRRRRGPTRCCSATSSSPAIIRSASSPRSTACTIAPEETAMHARRFHRQPDRAHAESRATSCRSAPSRWWCSR